MFSISHIKEGGFEKTVLQDGNTGTAVELIPSCGAILHGFSVDHHGNMLNLVEQYDSSEDFGLNVASKGFKSCKLSPFACRINKALYRFGGKEYRIEKFLLNGSALHGLLFDAVFEETERVAEEDKAQLTLLHQYGGTDPGYPFHFDCRVSYILGKDNSLDIRTTIINRDKGLIPVQDGWHPYFQFGNSINELELEFQSKEMLEFTDELIPTGRLIPYQEFGSIRKIGDTFFDNCFTLNFAECEPLCVLRDPKRGIQLEIRPAESYPYLQLYTPPHRNSIAIENLSAAPDAFNNGMGMITLEPGGKVDFETNYRVRKTDG